MNIRLYQDKDYNQVKEILQQGDHFDDVWDSQEHWDEKSRRDPESILIAENEDEIVGCLLIIRDKWTNFLFRLAVKENYRGNGIGSKLMAAAEDQLRKNGEDEVAIFVNEDKKDLQEYYKKRGYIVGGKYRCMYKRLQE